MTNGGAATNSALGNITLADGTLTATTGSPAGTASGQGYGSWNLNGTVTSTGTSLISSSAGAGIPITLNATNGLSSPATIFDVQSGTLTVSAVLGQVTRSGNETVGSLTKDGAGTMILSGANNYTGDTLVNAGDLTLASTGGMKFVIGASGVNNKISGDASPGNLTLDGTFTFDLTGAGTTYGNFWNIVDLANLGTVAFDTNFNVADFSFAGGGLWNRTFSGTDYQFSTTSGVLTVIPEPTSALGGLLLTAGLLRRRRKVEG
jgi:fibronectin-binding autotransporter adhesin